MVKFKNSKFFLEVNDEVKAEATLLWLKFNVNGKTVRQPYITDVASYQKGCGFILMNSIIEHFKSKKTNRPGYNCDAIRLDVNPNNFRAIKLYERVGFKYTNWAEDIVERYLLEMYKQIN